MKKIKNIVIGGIENKVFNLILLTVLLTSAAFIAVMYYQNRMLSGLNAETTARQHEAIGAVTSSVMDTVVNENMGRTTQLEAMIANELFHGLETRVQMLGDYARKLFADPEEVEPAEYAAPDPATNGQVKTQLLLADDVEEISPELDERLGIAANMSDMMASLFGASEVTNSCFIALPEGAFLVTDNRAATKYHKDGTIINYDPRTRPWYQQAVEEEELIFTDVEVDAFTGDIGIVCAMPIFIRGKLEAVVGSDLFLTSMRDAVQASEENGGFVCVINQNGHVVFSPKTESVFQVLSSSEAVDLRESENQEFAALITDALKGQTDVRKIELEDGTWYMCGAPLETVGWALIASFDQAVVNQPEVMLQETYGQIQEGAALTYLEKSKKSGLTIIVLLIVVLMVLSIMAIVLGKRIVRPLNRITKRIAGLGGNNLEFKMEDAYRTGDEIEVLAESFAGLSHKTIEYMDEIRTVTAEKERIGTELQMANQIQEGILPSIFPAFPDRSEFEIYATMRPAREVGGDFYDFFLTDEDHLCMVMADVSGKGVPAALFMMASKIILQSCAMLGNSPAGILTRTNEAICSNNRMEMFVTVWVGILEISTGLLTAASAGHEYPAVMKNGRFALYHDMHGFVVGGLENVRYKEYTMQLEEGDKIFLYTDGLAEARNSEKKMFGTDRIIEALNQKAGEHPEEILANVQRIVDEFAGSEEQFDDLTMLCVEYKGSGTHKA